MEYILAIDSGGTKSEAALVRGDGTVLGWGICRTPGLNGRSDRSRREAVRDALAGVQEEISLLHVACLGGILPDGIFESERDFRLQVHAVGEYEGALNLVGRDHGVVVLAGTGAFVHVQAPDGRVKLLDGLGPLLGDYGSGYHIGYLAMRAAMKSEWHPRRHTALQEVVFSTFSVRDRDEALYLNFAGFDGCVVAALALEVDRAANAGDAIAQGILEEAAAALAETLRDALDSLDLAGEPMLMVGTGSVAKRSKIYWSHFCDLARQFAPRLQPELEPLPSAAGMALAVLNRQPGIDRAQVRANLVESVSDFLNKMDTQLS